MNNMMAKLPSWLIQFLTMKFEGDLHFFQKDEDYLSSGYTSKDLKVIDPTLTQGLMYIT